MNRTPDVELVLREYLADELLSAPDYVLTVVAERIAAQPQRRMWRLPGRPAMLTNLKLAIGLAAVVALSVAAVALFGNQSDTTPTPSVSPTATPLASGPPPSSNSDAGDIPCYDGTGCRGRLEAGTYDASRLSVPLSYTVPEGWQNTFDEETGFQLQPSGSARTNGLFVFMDPHAASQARCGGYDVADGVGTSAAELAEWVAQHPGLTASEPVPVTIGGLEGQAIDYVRGAQVRPCVMSAVVFVGGADAAWNWDIDSNTKIHAALLDVGDGRTILVLVDSPIETFDALLAAATPILESFVFTP